jgi:LCP family protein required for cell wall assembly
MESGDKGVAYLDGTRHDEHGTRDDELRSAVPPVEFGGPPAPDPARPPRRAGQPGSTEPGKSKPAKQRRRKGPVWARLLVWFGAALMLLSSGTLVTAKLLLDRYTGAVHQTSMLGSAAAVPPRKGVDPLQGALNMLLVGVDERTYADDPAGTRADSIIVLHINAAHDKAYLLSLPRDTLVDIPAFPKTHFTGSHEKVNAAFQHGSDNGGGREGGFELLATTVHNLTGLSFNAGAIVNFAGFEAVVTAMGGVDMCIDQKVVSIHLDANGHKLKKGRRPATYLPGCQHLLPWQALDYVRQRHTDGGDYDRQRHQQQFLNAIGKQALSTGVVTNPGKLDAVLTAAGHTLTVDPGAAKLTDWLFLLKGAASGGLHMLKTNGGKFDDIKCPDGSACEALSPDSLQMFTAAKNDAMPDFLATHPTWVANDK